MSDERRTAITEVVLPRNPEQLHSALTGIFDAMIGDEDRAHTVGESRAYAHGREIGVLIFTRLAGETLGQAEAFLEVRHGLRRNDSPDLETLISRLEELADAAEHRRRQADAGAGTPAYEAALARRDAMIDAKNLVIKARDGKTIR